MSVDREPIARSWSPGSASPGPPRRGCCSTAAPGCCSPTPPSRPSSPSWSRPGPPGSARWTRCPRAPTSWSPRRAGGRTRRSWPTPPAAASRWWGSRSWPGGCACPAPDGTPAPWLAVTGTNGKTTTVTMLEAILLAAGRRAVAAGQRRAGRWSRWSPPGDDDGAPAYDVVAVELSSFQLHWSSSLAPAAAVVLNVADDHTDWHGSFAAYRDAKARILRAGAGRRRRRRGPGRRRPGRRPPAPGDRHPRRAGPGPARRPRPARWSTAPSPTTRRASCCSSGRTLPVPGPHNTVNALAAAALARAVGVPGRGGRPAAWPASAAARTATCWSPPSTAWTTSTTARPPTRTRPAPRSPPTRGWCGSPAGCSRAPTSIRWSPRSPPRLAGVVLLGRDRDRIAASLARHAPIGPRGHGARAATMTGWTGLTRVTARGDDDAGRRRRRAASPGPGTRCCSRRPPRPWTCSATTRTAAGRSPTPSAALG